MSQNENTLRRTGYILERKFQKYLIPSIMTAIAVSLNEFVDSILVSHLLGATAMSIVNVAFPVMLLVYAIFILFGIGGSTLYASAMGERKRKEAGTYFSVSMFMAVTVGIIVFAGGELFCGFFSNLLCNDSSILPLLTTYMRTLFVSTPFIIVVMILTYFFPVAGRPELTTIICVIANVVNLMFDYIYIRVFGMNVEGAAWATMTGYLAALVFILILFFRKKIEIQFTKPELHDFGRVKDIAKCGAAASTMQAGNAMKVTFCNHMALKYGGPGALVVFSVCMQIISIISIFYSGIIDAVSPLVATLFGQKDFKGISFVLKKGMGYIIWISVVFVLFLEAFPKLMLALYNVNDPKLLQMGQTAIRIFSVMFLIRACYLLFSIYARIIGKNLYAFIITFVDGFVGIVFFGTIFTTVFGLNGLWLAFPVTAIAVFAAVFLYNKHLEKKSDGKLQGFFLVEKEPDETAVYDVTITDKNEEISELSIALKDFCLINGVNEKTASRTALLIEEMSLYTLNHCDKLTKIDIITRITSEYIYMDFRSDGAPSNPLVPNEKDCRENVLLLQKMSAKMEYDYLLGMNSTRITVAK